MSNRKLNLWKCKCDCGKRCIVDSSQLKQQKTKSCGCLRTKHPYKWTFTHLINNARQNKNKCNITFKQFIKFIKIIKCHYCGKKIKWYKHSIHNGKLSPQRYNLDRKNNNKGYTIHNCVVCCKLCNKIKSNIFSYREMIKVGKILSKRIK